MKLPMLPADKANHVIYGWFVSSITLIVVLIITASLWTTILLSLSTVAVLAIFKEYYLDKKSLQESLSQGKKPTHSVDPMDIVYTIFGGIISIGYFLLINHLS